MRGDYAFELVAKAISIQFGIPQSTITETTVAAEVAGWDSFAHAQLLMAIESSLSLPIPLQPWMDAGNVGDLTELVRRSLDPGDQLVADPTDDDMPRRLMNDTTPDPKGPTEVFESANYQVAHYVRNKSVAVIVMVSAGRTERGEPVLEFKWTLERLDVSMIFIIDKHSRWYNYEETREVFQVVSNFLQQYKNVGVIGGSLGGAGALLAAHYLPKVSRILSFSPQYSLMPPFINFDTQYRDVVANIERHFNPHFAFPRARDKAVVMYGNLEWYDYLHSVMYIARGFPVLYVDNSLHNVALFLETQCGDNKLIELLRLFEDFDRPFTTDAVAALLAEQITPVGLKFEQLRFHIDRFDCEWLNGWADEDGPVWVSLIVNGSSAVDFEATTYRPDLEAAGIGEGRRAFNISLGNYLKAGLNWVVLKSGTRIIHNQAIWKNPT